MSCDCIPYLIYKHEAFEWKRALTKVITNMPDFSGVMKDGWHQLIDKTNYKNPVSLFSTSDALGFIHLCTLMSC